MPIDKKIKPHLLLLIGLFLVAFFVVFSSSYNPFNFRRMHVDSSVYITIAQGIIRGQMPYRDLVDNKGPITFLLSVPGLYLGGFTGIWITELFFMFISVLFAYKTALFFGDKYKAFTGTLFSFVIMITFFTVHAGTEEYSLPFLMASFYIFTKYYFSETKKINFTELSFLGFNFACAVLIRLNMFPLWTGFCLVIFIETLLRRRFAVLGKYIAGFTTGILVVAIPVFLYLKLNNVFDDFIVQVIFSGASRGFGGTGIKEMAKNFYIIVNRSFSIAPLVFGLYFIVTKYRQKEFTYYLGYTFSYLLTVLFLSFSWGLEHYNMVLIPYFIPIVSSVTGFLYKTLPLKKRKYFAIICFLSVVLSEGLVNYIHRFSKIFYDDSGSVSKRAGKIIDENTKPGDKILSLNNALLYPFTQRDPVSKYCYQGGGIDPIPGATEEFIADVMANKPVIIGIFSDNQFVSQDLGGWKIPIVELVEKKYQLLFQDKEDKLFIRKSGLIPRGSAPAEK